VTALVLLAGMNCTADLWTGCGLDDALTPALAARTMDEQVEQLLRVLPTSFVLGGLSLGGIVAMALAHRAPERVAGLCLVSTNAKEPTDAQRAGWRRWRDRLRAGESPRALQASIVDSLLSAAAQRRPELSQRTLAMGDATGSATLDAQLQLQSTRTDLRPGLRSVSVPTLIVSGAADPICPPEFHTEIASAVRGARVVSLDGGHLLPLERPEAFGALVRSWRTRCV
jgi:pimeloyl-ACP methyl ester carboxylesterase